MGERNDSPEINPRVYDFCARAFGTTKKLLKLNIKLHQDEEGENATVEQGDIFLFNQKGDLVYTVYKELDFATNLKTGRWADSNLAEVFRAVDRQPQPNISGKK